MPPAAQPSTSIAQCVGSAMDSRNENHQSASASSYGCGNLCVRLRHTLRLFANRSSAPLSLRTQSRTTHLAHSIFTHAPFPSDGQRELETLNGRLYSALVNAFTDTR